MVPRVILAMRLMGLDKAAIEKVCWQNPKDFFKLPVE
jgi:predicted metal-dependent TIM-barrel fold hydrolase